MSESQPNEWSTKVRALNLSQPDGSTCQSACIAMAVGTKDIRSIRQQLLQLGPAGSPATMGQVLRRHLGKRYIFDESASLNDMADYLKDGELIITHGWFTSSGHVICLDGLKGSTLGGPFSFNVKDPWSEFDGTTWTYNKPSVHFYDGFYSDRLIYAACVSGSSRSDAAACYLTSSVNCAEGRAWAHRILP
jgi:hypothetical protein